MSAMQVPQARTLLTQMTGWRSHLGTIVINYTLLPIAPAANWLVRFHDQQVCRVVFCRRPASLLQRHVVRAILAATRREADTASAGRQRDRRDRAFICRTAERALGQAGRSGEPARARRS